MGLTYTIIIGYHSSTGLINVDFGGQLWRGATVIVQSYFAHTISMLRCFIIFVCVWCDIFFSSFVHPGQCLVKFSSGVSIQDIVIHTVAVCYKDDHEPLLHCLL